MLPALRSVAARLRAAGIEDAMFEARLLVAHALGVSPREVIGAPRAPPAEALEALVARRLAREPMALILGHQGFWTLDLEVSAATLIPRPDSETLIEAALAVFPDRGAVGRVLDLGTGTGCLLLSALAEFPSAWGVGVDRVPAAAALAARNARRNGLAGRAAFLCADWAAPLAARFDLVLSNPPYIPGGDIAGLMPEVARFEPRSALDGGPDGLDAYRRLLADLPRLLTPGGVAVIELGAGQSGAVAALAAAAGFGAPDLRCDLGGVARAMVLRAPAAQKTFGGGAPGL
jgi:release factor glutamine methyltransferase